MAAEGIRPHLPPRTALAFWLVAAIAAVLSLAAAVVGLSQSSAPGSSTATAVDELAARNQRIAFFEARAQNDPLDYLSLNVLAGEYLQRARETGDVGYYARADYAASTSLSILPSDNYSAVVALGALRLVNHDFAAARDFADQAIALKPRAASGYGIHGDALLNLGDYDAAASEYQRMVTLEPALPALSRLAGLAFIRGDRVDALDFWRQAVNRNDGLPSENLAWARVQLAGVHFAYGDLKSAEQEYGRALALYPGFTPALAGLGAVRAAQERWPEAISLYEDAQARHPQPAYVIALADIYARVGDTARAEDQYALVEALDRLYRANGINTDLQLALFYADHDRNLTEALATAERAYAAAPSVYAADALAWALYKDGRYADASEMIEVATRLGTPEASFYYHAGLIDLATGDRAGAVEALRHALSLNPHFSPLHAPEAKQLLAQIGAGK